MRSAISYYGIDGTSASAGGATDPYFRELADVTVMSKDEEADAAMRLVELRRTLWTSILGYPPFIAAIGDVLAARLSPEECPRPLLTALQQAARAVRDRALKSHEEALAAARTAVVDRLVFADPDGVLSDLVLADLSALEGDGVATTLEVRPPYRDSAPFFRYLTAVRRAQHALAVAKAAFVRSHLRLVVALARRFRRSAVPMQDLIQEGNLGLMKAVARFDPRRGCRFSTYGAWWIRHAMTRAIVDKDRSVRLPMHMIDACNKVNRARRELEARHGRAPTDEELAEATGISLERIERMHWSLIEAPLSLAQPTAPDGAASLVDTIADTSEVAPGERLDAELLRAQLQEVLTALSPIEADILRKRVGLDGEPELTLKEIGARYSLSRERIRQLQEQALAKLRREFSRRQLM